jgi:TRAP-type uncharacterized transport system fused permease subunit
MGAAAFLMLEYTNMPYSAIIKHAFLPAILTYASLLLIVHLESCKMDLKRLPRNSTLKSRLVGIGLAVSALFILMDVIHYASAWIPAVFGEYAKFVFAFLLLATYGGMVALSLRFPELSEDDNNLLTHLPAVIPVLFAGLHFLRPSAFLSGASCNSPCHRGWWPFTPA